MTPEDPQELIYIIINQNSVISESYLIYNFIELYEKLAKGRLPDTSRPRGSTFFKK